MRTHGLCPTCGHDGVLPGRRNRADPRPVCMTCAGIPGNFTCTICQCEGEMYRRGQCARCALRDDLCKILLHHPADLTAMQTLIEVLCGVDRPESILTWKRNIEVLQPLGGITSGAIPLTHDGLTAAGRGKHVSHLRSILEHHGLLPPPTSTSHGSNCGWPQNSMPSTPPQFAPRSSSSRAGTTYAAFAVNPNPANHPTAQSDRRNKRSPKPSNSSPGLNTLTSAPSPTARNKTSMSTSPQARPPVT